MEKKQWIVGVLAFAVGVFMGVGVEEYREHAESRETANPAALDAGVGLQVYAYPAWGFSVQYPVGYAPYVMQDEDTTFGLRIMKVNSEHVTQNDAEGTDCVDCAVSVSVVKNFLRDESGMLRTPEEYRANQELLGHFYVDTQFAGHSALLSVDTKTGRRDYNIFVKTKTGYDWYCISTYANDPFATKIVASTYVLSR